MLTVYRSGVLTGMTIGYVAAVALFAPAGALAPRNDIQTLAATIQEASARFQDVETALALGYLPDPGGRCISATAEGLRPDWGVRGIQYRHPGLLGLTATTPRIDGVGLNVDFLNPSILLYEPQADGSLVLVGVKNLVFEAAWRAAGNTDAPTLGGRSWTYIADDPATPHDEADGFAPHWEQRVRFRHNPFGPLDPFNPNLTCRHHAATQAEPGGLTPLQRPGRYGSR